MTDIALTFGAVTPRLAWTLLHSLWQGAVIATVLTIALGMSARATANLRYAVSCAALAAFVFACGVTFLALAPVDTPLDRLSSYKWTNAPAQLISRSATTLSVRPEHSKFPLQLVVILWVIGVAAMSSWHIVGWLWLHRSNHGRTINDRAMIEKLTVKLRLNRVVRLVESARLDIPAVIGVLRPVILLPLGIFNDLTAAQFETILAHELAHIRRHDYLVNLIQAAVETLLFYHPATWWISAQIRREREQCCDDIAASVGGARAYASALLILEQRRTPRVNLLIAATGGPLLQRIQRLCGKPPMTNRRPFRSIAAAAISLACIGLPLIALAQSGQLIQPTASASTQPSRPSFKIVIGRESLIYREHEEDLANLRQELDQIPPAQRPETVLEIAAASPDITVQRYFQAEAQLAPLVKEYGLAYLSQTGIHPTADPAAEQDQLPAEAREYYIGGHVHRPGVYSLAGRNITLKQAITSAGGPDSPESSTFIRVIRRTGGGHEIITLQNVKYLELFSGEQRDSYVHPNDTIMITPFEWKGPTTQQTPTP